MSNFFDKYELYTEGDSVYCYPSTTVLKNKLNIRNQNALWQAESDIAFVSLLELELNPIVGNFDKKHLFAIHYFVFRDFYEFAGQLRKEDISKGTTKFCVYKFIDSQLDELFGTIREMKIENNAKSVVAFLSYLMAELNIIHPFREGNGRVIREFTREFALHLGYSIYWERLNKTELIEAMIKSVYDTSDLKLCLKKAIKKCK